MSIGQTSDREERKFVSGSTDRELWSSDLAWLLLSADSALGQRGTLAAVVAAIERGGSPSSSDSAGITDEQLGAMWGRKAHEKPRVGHVERAGAILKRWHALPIGHRRVLAAHYVGTVRARTNPHFEGRFGYLAGVVVEQWLATAAKRRERARAMARNIAADGLEAAYSELEAVEPRLARSRALLTHHKRLARMLRQEPARSIHELLAFRAGSAAHLLERAARPARSLRDRLLSEHADPALPEASDPLGELDALAQRAAVTSVEAGPLKAAAEKAVRAAHRAWNGQRQQAEDEDSGVTNGPIRLPAAGGYLG